MDETLETKSFNELINLFGKLFPTATLQSLGYYVVINYRQFEIGRKSLNNSLEKLLFQDFARGQSSHMTEGIFGQYVWIQKMQFTKMQVISDLLQCINSGHRLLKCLISIKKIDKPPKSDWIIFRKRLNRLHDDFRIFRNALEHIEETIEKGLTLDIENSWHFNRLGVFEYEVNQKKYFFDFSENATSHLAQLDNLYIDFIQMLKARPIQ